MIDNQTVNKSNMLKLINKLDGLVFTAIGFILK